LPSCYEGNLHVTFKDLNPENYISQSAQRGIKVELADAYCSIWSAIVREYSRSALTFPGDKMVAISGIAKHLRSAMKDEYVAGMWRSHLEHWLLWWVKGPRSTEGAAWPSSRPSTYRAPTWSWASVDGAVVIPLTSYESKLEFHVSDFKLDYATEDTTGATTGGWMDLTASLKPIRLLQQSPDDLLSWDIAMSGTALGRRDGLYIEFDVPPSSNDAFDTDNAEERLFCVLSQTTNLQSDYVFILLLRLIDTEKMLYERFGAADLAYKQNAQGWDVFAGDISEEVKQNLPCLRYENGLHTVRII
jgi:hypothetical protein